MQSKFNQHRQITAKVSLEDRVVVFHHCYHLGRTKVPMGEARCVQNSQCHCRHRSSCRVIGKHVRGGQ
jgi:erythromycin esterase-like protein